MCFAVGEGRTGKVHGKAGLSMARKLVVILPLRSFGFDFVEPSA